MELRPELGVLPTRLQRLPLDQRGYPVPWFVEWIDGKPEFRAMDPKKFGRAFRERRCWVCGDPLGRHLSFVIGPMCAINRTSAEPPCHHECATWSAQHCPFLSRPHMVRREDELINSDQLPEASLSRNPGAAGVWTTATYRVFKAPDASASGYLIEMGPPEKVEWFAEGRPATRDEVLQSINSGLPSLEAMCERERTALDRLDAHKQLAQQRQDVEQWLPVEASA